MIHLLYIFTQTHITHSNNRLFSITIILSVIYVNNLHNFQIHDVARLPRFKSVGPAHGDQARGDLPGARVPALQAVLAVRERLHLRQVRVLLERRRPAAHDWLL